VNRFCWLVQWRPVKNYLLAFLHFNMQKYVRDNPQYERYVLERKRIGCSKAQDGQSRNAPLSAKRSTDDAHNKRQHKRLRPEPCPDVAGDVIDLTQESSTKPKPSAAEPFASLAGLKQKSETAVSIKESSEKIGVESSVSVDVVDEEPMASPYSVISNDTLGSDNCDAELLEPISDDDLDVSLTDVDAALTDPAHPAGKVEQPVVRNDSQCVSVIPVVSGVDLLDPISDDDEDANVADGRGKSRAVDALKESVVLTGEVVNPVEADDSCCYIVLSSSFNAENVDANNAEAAQLIVSADTPTVCATSASEVVECDGDLNDALSTRSAVEAVVDSGDGLSVEKDVLRSVVVNLTEVADVQSDSAILIVGKDSNLESCMSSNISGYKLDKQAVIRLVDCVSNKRNAERKSVAVLNFGNIDSNDSSVQSVSSGITNDEREEVVISSDCSSRLSDTENFEASEPVSSGSSQMPTPPMAEMNSLTSLTSGEGVVHHSDGLKSVHQTRPVDKHRNVSACSDIGLVETDRQMLPDDKSSAEFQPLSSVDFQQAETSIDANNEDTEMPTDDDDDFEIELL